MPLSGTHELKMTSSLSLLQYELFLRPVTPASRPRVTLAKAKEIHVQSSRFSNKWVIVCDRSNAVALYNAATESCPEALPEIAGFQSTEMGVRRIERERRAAF